MNKKVLNVFFVILIILAIILLEMFLVFLKLNYFQIANGKENVNDYNERYIVENVLYAYITNLRNARENYEEFKKALTAKSYISEKDILKIIDIYNLEKYEYEINIISIVKLSDKQYSCKYSLSYNTEALVDGYAGETINNEGTSEVREYINEVIVDINYEKNAFKVLYSKFDLGGGEYYEA